MQTHASLPLSRKEAIVTRTIHKDFRRNRLLYLMILPVLIYYSVFQYGPMYGALIAFKDYSPSAGIWGSDWIGFTNFSDFFNGYYFSRIIKNTVLISVYTLVFEFPAPILLALLVNELRNRTFRRIVQSVTYMPYFISLVVICGMIKDFTNTNGVINQLFGLLGYEGGAMLQNSDLFRPIYVFSEIWQHIGWESIIYIAALANIDQEQFEAADMDGAGRLSKIWYITLPGLVPTIMIMLILRIGNMMNVGFEKIILLYNPATYETADVISTYVYRKGILEMSWSFGAAVGLFNSVINLLLLVLANYISRRVNQNSLW
ncbi:ABC transporter permease [Cohnella fermenti]|uniref:Sugar ABC transporter permease n=1 Tax=Cohnella fermenti TaxID=2565925 RepID=A0A4S4BZU6_9BACL|nr:ABC transporter permease subunit [Cohnella fermenti]THF78740.1 sugar ABC transporter permease [Cohnella fermenti]